MRGEEEDEEEEGGRGKKEGQGSFRHSCNKPCFLVPVTYPIPENSIDHMTRGTAMALIFNSPRVLVTHLQEDLTCNGQPSLPLKDLTGSGCPSGYPICQPPGTPATQRVSGKTAGSCSFINQEKGPLNPKVARQSCPNSRVVSFRSCLQPPAVVRPWSTFFRFVCCKVGRNGP